MNTFQDWITYKPEVKTVFLKDWADGKSVCAIGDACSETDKEDFKWVGFTSNPNTPEDWRYLSLDAVVFSLCTLFGKDEVQKTIDVVVTYDQAKDIKFK